MSQARIAQRVPEARLQADVGAPYRTVGPIQGAINRVRRVEEAVEMLSRSAEKIFAQDVQDKKPMSPGKQWCRALGPANLEIPPSMRISRIL